MKPYIFPVSVKNGSNEVVSRTFGNWGGVSERCYIRIQKDSISYSIKSVEKIKFSEKFSVKNSKTIILEDDSMSDYILDNDECELVFKEFEIFEVESILDSGSGYKKGDLIFLSGGTPVNSFSDIDNRASLEITNVGKDGEIKSFKVKNYGRYSKTPDSINIVSTNNDGIGAELNVEFKQKSDRTIVRREILNKVPSEGKLILFLDSSIPENESFGILTIAKEKIVLESSYMGVSSEKASHEIIRDFTPNYRLPFAAPNSQNIEFVFNQAISILDKELKRIENRISSTDD